MKHIMLELYYFSTQAAWFWCNSVHFKCCCTYSFSESLCLSSKAFDRFLL